MILPSRAASFLSGDRRPMPAASFLSTQVMLAAPLVALLVMVIVESSAGAGKRPSPADCLFPTCAESWDTLWPPVVELYVPVSGYGIEKDNGFPIFRTKILSCPEFLSGRACDAASKMLTGFGVRGTMLSFVEPDEERRNNPPIVHLALVPSLGQGHYTVGVMSSQIVRVSGATEADIFYGLQTLAQVAVMAKRSGRHVSLVSLVSLSLCLPSANTTNTTT